MSQDTEQLRVALDAIDMVAPRPWEAVSDDPSDPESEWQIEDVDGNYLVSSFGPKEGSTPQEWAQSTVAQVNALEVSADRPSLAQMFLDSAPERTTSTTGERVDAWLRAHAEWVAASADRQLLRSQWRECCRSHGPESAPARGVLLDLVSLAWGCDEWRRLTIEPAGRGWCVVVRNGRHRPPSRARSGWDLDRLAHHRYLGESGPFGINEFDSEVDALLAALEAAPV